MNAVAIILASGSGQRFGATNLPKHLTPILEVPILIWTLRTILESKLFTSISVVTRESDIEETNKVIENYFSDSLSFVKVVKGADERMKSFLSGLGEVEEIDDNTIISLFDANRPFITVSQIEELYESAVHSGCSCPIRPIVNGIAQIDSMGCIVDVPDKSKLVEFVTPEFIQFKLLNEALKNSPIELLSLVEYSLYEKVKPKTVEAKLLCSKLTYPEDATFIEEVAIKSQLSRPNQN
ncbi:2-C-methyl-D-erythritol 4-phosphate cytidylyltransferase [Arcobacter sp. LA11]|uniref:2-C-methyl-D-erythritol 4-phosphate cytidylyltransferase n=1 Tax=Arcobacter sp. LA11 TaxID=1898176 RepID=UPI0009326F75|nr:2-C-methyl-D-erythritol 4-phosphate cytidylyltransferase [Arcobacter sp. LA11]